jgi:voltage-gated potassium channel
MRERLQLRFYERLTLVRAVQAIVVAALVLTLGAALAEWLIEPETFGSFGDACWWAIVTVSTTGYGDLAPHTTAGKIVAAWVMVTALAWVPAVTAVVMALFIRRQDERHPEARPVTLEHVLERLDRLERRLVEGERRAA